MWIKWRQEILMQSSFRKEIVKLLTTTVAAVLLMSMAGDAQAMPVDGQIAAGAATVSQTGGTLTINQSTTNLIMNWQSFGVGVNEKVNFVQPSSASVALNRVLGNDPSYIYGQLTANGRLFLTNPNGVLFSPGAQINAGGLVASALNISDSDFLAGRYTFSKGAAAGSVVNQGSLTAADGGYIVLLAPEVRNQGVIVAKMGTVALGAGDKVTLDFAGDGLVNLEVEAGAANAQAINKHLIQASGGTVIMSAKAAVDLAGTVVNNTGVIEAKSLAERNGVIRLEGGTGGEVINSGILDASGLNSGEKGGTIKVLGPRVRLASGSVLDVSGDKGGGTVLIGGNWQGQGPDSNAKNTYVDKNVSITADAVTTGSGGKVVVWANDKTEFHGSISARGGLQGGDGGNVEVSGKELDYTGLADLRAPQGKIGNVLLDPADLFITIQPDAPGTNINSTNLINQLKLANVTLQTSPSGGGNGDINVWTSLLWDAPTKLTLSAHRNINVGSTIATNRGAVVLRADLTGTGTGTVIFSGIGAINLSGGGTASIYYNPVSYLTPTNYTSKVNGGILTSYMLVNNINNLQNVSQNLSGTYAQGKDIDAASTKNWNGGLGFIPLGDSGTPFVGTFDGNGYTINNLYMGSNTSGVGLFGFASGAIIRNVGLMNVDIAGENSVGALVGNLKSGSVSNSYSTGLVRGKNSVGGLIGLMDSCSVTNSYSMGAVNGEQDVGGLIGSLLGGSVTNSYSTGVVSGVANTGGLVGFKTGGTVIGSFWDIDTSGKNASAGGVGQTTAQMMQQANFPWDFDGTWGIVNGVSYPYLRWQFSSTPQIVSGTATSINSGKSILVAAYGSILGQAYTGANGFYYFVLPANSVSNGSALVTYLSGDILKANTVRLSNGGHLINLGLTADTMTIDVSGGTVSNAALAQAKGSLNSADIIYHIAGNDLTVSGSFRTTGGAYNVSGNMYSTGSQVYGGTVNLSGDALLAAGSGIAFNGAVNAAGHNLTLESSGPVTQTAAITTNGLKLMGSGNFTLDNEGNSIATLAGNAGTVKFKNTGNLVIGSIDSTTGLTTTGDATVITSGDFIINPGASVISNGASVTLVTTGGSFVNYSGPGAIGAPSGRWLVYSTDPARNTLGGMSGFSKLYNRSYAANPPDLISAGNYLIYSLNYAEGTLPSTSIPGPVTAAVTNAKTSLGRGIVNWIPYGSLLDITSGGNNIVIQEDETVRPHFQ